MRYMLTALMAISITGCSDISGGNKENVSIYHDDQRFVTCYLYNSDLSSPAGISCIPDNQLPSPDECVPGTEVYGDDGFPRSCVSFKSKHTEYR